MMKAEQLERFDSVSGCTRASGVGGVGCCSAAIFYRIISRRITHSCWINVKPTLIMLRSRPTTTFSTPLCADRQTDRQTFINHITVLYNVCFTIIRNTCSTLSISPPAGIPTIDGQL